MTEITFSPAAAPFAERLLEPAREIIARYPTGRERSALLPLLHLVQTQEGHVSPGGVAFCAEVLGINKAQVGAVATFYTMYKRRPTSDWLVSVCTNTMCNVLGGQEVYDTLSELLGVGHNETTSDGSITLEHAECLAACDYGPVMTVNYEFFDQVDPGSAVRVVEGLRAGNPPLPTRGARLCSFKEMSLQLAGFADPRDAALGDGPAGEPTLRGVRLAQEYGISVPGFDPETPIPRKGAPGAKPPEAKPAEEGKVATAAKKVAGTVKAAAAAVKDTATGEKPAKRTSPRKAATAPDAAAAEAAGAASNVPAGDAKPAGDAPGRAQAENLTDAAEGTKRGATAAEESEK